MVLEHTTLLEIPLMDQNPDPITPVEGTIFLPRLGAEGLLDPDALAISEKNNKERKIRQRKQIEKTSVSK